ncbi:MAG: photosystem II biogenesis protein Psp29, partial [Prochlorothrix sp.]
FYAAHTRPISSIYRRVLEEMMVEMHLLGVNASFNYDSIYALGVVTAFDRFMAGYRPESDIDSIFKALCQAIGSDAATYRKDAQALLDIATSLTPEDFVALIDLSAGAEVGGSLRSTLAQLSDQKNFKYSRLFAIGLFTLLETAAPDWLEDGEKQGEIWKTASQSFNLPLEKLKKDVELYRSNLEKLAQARVLMEEVTQAERKKREQREQERKAKAEAKAAKAEAGAEAETPAEPAAEESAESDSPA